MFPEEPCGQKCRTQPTVRDCFDWQAVLLNGSAAQHLGREKSCKPLLAPNTKKNKGHVTTVQFLRETSDAIEDLALQLYFTNIAGKRPQAF